MKVSRTSHKGGREEEEEEHTSAQLYRDSSEAMSLDSSAFATQGLVNRSRAISHFTIWKKRSQQDNHLSRCAVSASLEVDEAADSLSLSLCLSVSLSFFFLLFFLFLSLSLSLSFSLSLSRPLSLSLLLSLAAAQL